MFRATRVVGTAGLVGTAGIVGRARRIGRPGRGVGAEIRPALTTGQLLASTAQLTSLPEPSQNVPAPVQAEALQAQTPLPLQVWCVPQVVVFEMK